MFRPDVLRAYWLSPAGLVILAATGLALALRLFMLSRPQFLTGVTEYDDGVYLGGAIRLISGTCRITASRSSSRRASCC